jgi:RNA polymerase sigma factor (sigma-70 family)
VRKKARPAATATLTGVVTGVPSRRYVVSSAVGAAANGSNVVIGANLPSKDEMATAAVTTVHEALRPRLFGIAYRMLGSAAEAEDVVQEAFLRLHQAARDGAQIRSPAGFLVATATRLGIDQLRSARVRREQYVGPWLPEPLLVGPAEAVARVETAEALSLAFLLLLERLSPTERAAFVLREAFGYGYDEIARILDATEPSCRQLVARARRRVREPRQRFTAAPARPEELAGRFLAAAERGDTAGLIAMLADDAAAYFDGGGRAPAPRQTVRGAAAIARVLVGLAEKARRDGLAIVPIAVNGQPGFAVRDPSGALITVAALAFAADRVAAVYAVANPEKLGRDATEE